MDKVESYRQIIERILTKYAEIPDSYNNSQRYTIFDQSGDHYLMMNVGWDQRYMRRFHGSVIHVDIIDGKCWIQFDGIEHGIVEEMEAAGIPKSDIVLGFRPPEIRPLTGYAVA